MSSYTTLVNSGGRGKHFKLVFEISAYKNSNINTKIEGNFLAE